jgi:hypothetical protein
MRLLSAGEPAEDTARAVLAAAADTIHNAIVQMMDARAAEPVYRVEDALCDRRPVQAPL